VGTAEQFDRQGGERVSRSLGTWAGREVRYDRFCGWHGYRCAGRLSSGAQMDPRGEPRSSAIPWQFRNPKAMGYPLLDERIAGSRRLQRINGQAIQTGGLLQKAVTGGGFFRRAEDGWKRPDSMVQVVLLQAMEHEEEAVALRRNRRVEKRGEHIEPMASPERDPSVVPQCATVADIQPKPAAMFGVVPDVTRNKQDLPQPVRNRSAAVPDRNPDCFPSAPKPHNDRFRFRGVSERVADEVAQNVAHEHRRKTPHRLHAFHRQRTRPMLSDSSRTNRTRSMVSSGA